MKCPDCGAATLAHDTRDLPYACKAETTTIPAVTADWCAACGEAVMDVDESQRVAQALLELNTHSRKAPSPQAVLHAVASSTAIETGQSIAEIEARLRSKKGRFRSLRLAD